MKASLRPTRTTELHQANQIQALDLTPLAIYTRYRGHPQLCQEDHQRLFRYELMSTVKADGVCSTINDQNGVIAACAIKPLDWDTQHFGLPMARMSLAAAPTCPPSALSNLLRDTINKMRQETSILHTSCEVDIDDYLCLNALLGLGAEILDIKREYRWRSLKGIKPPKFLSLVREYREDDRSQCLALMAGVYFESRFSRDISLPEAKTTRLYEIWLEKILNNTERGRIALVMEKGCRVQACGAIERHDLSYAGIDAQIMSNGIYLSSREATGCYYPIIYSLAERSLSQFKSAQTCVSLNNRAATRVLERMNAGTSSTRYALRLFFPS